MQLLALHARLPASLAALSHALLLLHAAPPLHPPPNRPTAPRAPATLHPAPSLTPVSRIFDLSHNQLGGAFPTWLIANLPLLADSCHCSVGVSLDAERFACPSGAMVQLNRRAQEVLHRYEALQCMSAIGKRQQQVRQQAAGGGHCCASGASAGCARRPGGGRLAALARLPIRSRRHAAGPVLLGTLLSPPLLPRTDPHLAAGRPGCQPPPP